jgi:hypothetical protein
MHIKALFTIFDYFADFSKVFLSLTFSILKKEKQPNEVPFK